jgi:tRNA threonylcarbamoyladenosine biosynthesis protein TsaB
MDARMNEVYWGIYERENGGALTLHGMEHVGPPESVSLGGRLVLIGAGTGFNAYPVLNERFPGLRIHDTALPMASDIAILAELALQRGEGVQASEAQPVYLRDQVAWVSAAQPK